MAEGFVAILKCAVCGEPCSRVEVIAPGERPAEWAKWDKRARHSFTQRRQPQDWWLLFEGVAAGNGGGDPIDEDRERRLAEAFAAPYEFERVHTAGFYDDAGFCGDCGKPYCYRHWRVSGSGYGHCPEGYGKSLDPHWSPEDFDG